MPDNDPVLVVASGMVSAQMRWKIGRHTLICADSTTLPTPRRASVLVYDPPWDAELPPPARGFRHTFAFTDARHMPSTLILFGIPSWLFVWDCVSSWWTPSSPLMRLKLCAWFGPRAEYAQERYLLAKVQPARRVRNNRGAYHYAGRPGTMLSDVYCQPITEPRAHRHAKPTDWVAAILGNCIARPSVIYDPFAGSGMTILAAERTGHTAICVEREAAECDAMLARFEAAGMDVKQA